MPPPAAVETSSPRASRPPRPWHQGISDDRKQRAHELFTEARALHRRMMFAEARVKYEEALAAWEHPDLRLYLARVLKSLGLPLLAYENLRLALRWGPGTLAPETEQEARAAMRALMEHELAAIEIRCDEPGAAVLLDDKPWFVGPGAERRMVTPGEHVVMVRRDGYSTVVKPILVIAGKEASGQLARRVDTVIGQPRWPAWVPWTMLGAGAALGVAGGGLMWSDAAHEGDQASGDLAIGAFVAGGATMITGTVLLLMNGPQVYRVHDRGEVEIELRPIASLGPAGLSARLVF
ncbi:hypothetical protein BE04_01055 [Sorangium cellulosum]|uniref:PEGA domain-containing protein n=1 Tax=Sorangium cellulosum TaxID=56 RepID=A0A150P7N7_SORCE|nr:hypothetical protein BE04_01055 [Sorangium cellulosum]